MLEYDTLDVKAETQDLSDEERGRLDFIYRELNS